MCHTGRIISFKLVTPEDLPLILKWYLEPHVQEWYSFDEPGTMEGVEEKFGDIFSGEDSVLAYLMEFDGAPIGYIQAYWIGDHVEYAQALQVEPRSVGVDLFIGDPDHVHRGLGNVILRQFVQEVVFQQMGAKFCVIGPEVGNKIAIRAYERAGFRYLKTVNVPGERAPEYLMICERDIDLDSSPRI